MVLLEVEGSLLAGVAGSLLVEAGSLAGVGGSLLVEAGSLAGVGSSLLAAAGFPAGVEGSLPVEAGSLPVEAGSLAGEASSLLAGVSWTQALEGWEAAFRVAADWECLHSRIEDLHPKSCTCQSRSSVMGGIELMLCQDSFGQRHISPAGFNRMSAEQEVSPLLQSRQPTVAVTLPSEESTPDTWVTLPELAELLRVSVVTTPETLVVTPVEAVAGLPLPDRDCGEWKGAITS